jgi:hypothetical protein
MLDRSDGSSAVLPMYGADVKLGIDLPDGCTKLKRSASTMTHGALTLQCPHGILLGFLVLSGHESTRTVFNLLRRKLRTGPRLIVYDNACALWVTCLKRDPAFFARTSFRVDRFHFSNHVSCSEGMSLNVWPKDTPVISEADLDAVRRRHADSGTDVTDVTDVTDMPLPDTKPITYDTLNSSVSEQNNAKLRYISTPLAYMNHDNYVTHLKQFVYRINIARLAKMFGQTELYIMGALWRDKRSL